jgi:hypothetical protein
MPLIFGTGARLFAFLSENGLIDARDTASW